jgi:signal transduction histidine kinase
LPKHVVTTILTQMGAHSVTIWERKGDVLDLLGIVAEGRFKTSIEAGYFGGSVPIFENVPPLWGDALQVGMHFVIEDISIDPARIILADGRTAIWPTAELPAPFADLKKHFIAGGVRALLISPMMMAGQLAGIIGIRFTGTRVFGPEEIELTKALAHQAMLAMQLMRLSEQSREAAVMAERNRMARDIHDTLAQGFTGVIMQLEAARGATTQGDLAEAANRIERASDLARSSLGEARRSVRALRPRSLRSGKLFLALDDLLKRMAEGTNLNAEFQAEGDARFIASDCEEGLLRITQEALTNAVKHANARNFKATLSIGADKIQLRLVDDGRGFDPQKEHDGFGLIGMKERVDRMGGEFIIRTKQSVGTEILVELKHQSVLKQENGNE